MFRGKFLGLVLAHACGWDADACGLYGEVYLPLHGLRDLAVDQAVDGRMRESEAPGGATEWECVGGALGQPRSRSCGAGSGGGRGGPVAPTTT